MNHWPDVNDRNGTFTAVEDGSKSTCARIEEQY